MGDSSSPAASAMDSSHPYYLHPSDSPGMNLISIISGINTQRTKGKKSKYNPNVTYTYCFRTGHVMDDCHRLHGYPEDFEFTKGKNSMIKGTTTFAGEDNSYQSSKEGGTTNFQHFTKEQMAEITQMVKEMQMSQSVPSTEINANGVAGALEHMCFEASSFSFMKPFHVPINISLPNSFKDLLMKRVVAFGELREGLYLLQPTNFRPSLNYVKQSVSFSKGSNSSFIHVSCPILCDTLSNDKKINHPTTPFSKGKFCPLD
ncbi:hypothetical protein H5410_044604 [Solanum commersonii]|uniref:Uncharacterized protein n=1 Tax=Solanum commersonii TaxID=4109 RepID=A0A9J5X8K8_SOLCO|nr:hypothetical protein H5410_044604 [Solanum commersonii]